MNVWVIISSLRHKKKNLIKKKKKNDQCCGYVVPIDNDAHLRIGWKNLLYMGLYKVHFHSKCVVF